MLSLVTQGELEDYVTILGYMDDPQPLMERCDLVLMCSRNEAFGLVTLEAMQVGKPVIGTRSGGTLELIKDGFNGLLYTPGDIEELSEKIIYLYDHPEIAQQMGKNGQKLASEKFNPDRYVEEILSIIKHLIA